MAKLQEILNNDMAKGAAIGFGVAAVAAATLPVIFTLARPFAREALKSGILLMEKGRELLSEAGEGFEDLVAEVKTELAQAQEEIAAGAAAAREDFAEATEDEQ